MKFEELEKIDCSDKIEKRKDGNNELSYLSWAWAWSIFKKKCPDATYTIKKFQNSKNELVPYMYDANTGYMVNTEITVENITYEMWLPVMNSANKAMKAEPYTYKTKFNGEKTVEAATMFDINKTIMRCLVKNMAMFGLGLYIYAGEDLPETQENQETKEVDKEEKKVAFQKTVESENNIDADLDLIEGIKTISDMENFKIYYKTNFEKVSDKKRFNELATKIKNKLEKGQK